MMSFFKIRKAFFAVLLFCGLALVLPAENIDLGINSEWYPNIFPETGTIFSQPFLDFRGFIYLPTADWKTLVAVESSHRDTWHLVRAEAGAVWVWGGPFYSEARYSLGIDSQAAWHHRAYMDLFMEKDRYYLTGSVKGGLSSQPQEGQTDWFWQGMGGATFYPNSWQQYNLRGYVDYESINDAGLQQWQLSLSTWTRQMVNNTFFFQASAGAGIRLFPAGDQPELFASLAIGPGFNLGANWAVLLLYNQDFPATGRSTRINTMLTGRLGS